MFEGIFYRCPRCGMEIQDKIQDGAEIECISCHRSFIVMLEEKSGKAGFIEVSSGKTVLPLNLPRGSIRASVTILMALSCWIMIIVNREVPGCLLSLLLTIIGYYFAFRKKMVSAQSKIYDASAQVSEPLNLPTGFIRLFLIAGFLVSALILYSRGKLTDVVYYEFFVILFGLVAGYIFAKLIDHISASGLFAFISHFKAAAVLIAAMFLTYMFLFDDSNQVSATEVLLACVISFYFGSRS